jgi:hypothetical protein
MAGAVSAWTANGVSRISGLLHQLRQVGADLTHLAVRAGRMNSVAPSWAALAATEVVVLVSGYQEQDIRCRDAVVAQTAEELAPGLVVRLQARHIVGVARAGISRR